MSLHLIVRADAEADITAAHDWYEEQQAGLGREFLDEISKAIAAVQSELLRFPYGIFFINRGDTVIVVAAMHFARNPRHLRHRI